MESVLIIDPDRQRSKCLTAVLNLVDYEAVESGDAGQGGVPGRGPEGFGAVIVADTGEGMDELIRGLREWGPRMPIILLQDSKGDGKGHSRLSTDAQAQLLGTLQTPVRYKELTSILQQADVFRKARAAGDASAVSGSSSSPELFRSLVGNSREIRRVRKLIEQVAESDATVLILGESGTGKEVVVVWRR